MSTTFRRIALTVVLTVSAALCTPAMLAQHPGGGPPPPPPPPSGGSGVGMGINIGPGGGMRSSNGPPNGGAMHRGSALGLPGRWWNDKQVINRYNLRPNQQRQMDAVFEAHRAALTESLQNLQHQRAQLGSLSQKDLQDETKVLAAIDRVVAARADLARQTTQVLTDLRKQLDPQQTTQLDKEIASAK